MTLNEIIFVMAAVVIGFFALIILIAVFSSGSKRVETDENYQEKTNYMKKYYMNNFGYGNSAYPHNGYYSQNGAYYGGNVNYNSAYRNFYGNCNCQGNQVYGSDARFANYYSEPY